MEEHDLKLTVSSSPHLRMPATVSHAMHDLIIALIPVTLVSILLSRFYANRYYKVYRLSGMHDCL